MIRDDCNDAIDDFRFSKTTLANGLDVIGRRQPQLPIVAINLWYHVGSKNEERTSAGSPTSSNT